MGIVEDSISTVGLEEGIRFSERVNCHNNGFLLMLL